VRPSPNVSPQGSVAAVSGGRGARREKPQTRAAEVPQCTGRCCHQLLPRGGAEAGSPLR